MKLKSLTLLTVFSCNLAFATDHHLVISKVDKKMDALNEEMNRPEQVVQTVPWHALDKRESAFWTSVTEAYDFLLKKNQNIRYNFLLSAAQALGNNETQADKSEALKAWIKNENHKIYQLGLSYAFYDEWKLKVAGINEAISEISSARPIVAMKSNARGTILDTRNFLLEIRNDLKNISSQTSDAPAPVATSELKSEGTPEFTFGHSLAVIITAIFSMGAGLLYPRKQRILVKKIIQKVPETLPPLPIEADLAAEESPVNTSEEVHAFDRDISGVSLEEECEKIFTENSHLLKVSNLKVLSGPRSPFKTTVTATQEQVKEALNWLLKGTIAVVNTTGAKASHLEWNCKENEGRISVEFVLHGLECDSKSLYLNTLIDGAGSAAAHFGRTEMALKDHLPVVAFKTGKKKTTVSLGVDSYSGLMNH